MFHRTSYNYTNNESLMFQNVFKCFYQIKVMYRTSKHVLDHAVIEVEEQGHLLFRCYDASKMY